MAKVRTLGIEEEFQIVDAETLELAFRAPELLRQLSTESYSAELQRSTVETNTEVVSTLDHMGLKLHGLRIRPAEMPMIGASLGTPRHDTSGRGWIHGR
jgi:carboxylate-amine ligase